MSKKLTITLDDDLYDTLRNRAIDLAYQERRELTATALAAEYVTACLLDSVPADHLDSALPIQSTVETALRPYVPMPPPTTLTEALAAEDPIARAYARQRAERVAHGLDPDTGKPLGGVATTAAAVTTFLPSGPALGLLGILGAVVNRAVETGIGLDPGPMPPQHVPECKMCGRNHVKADACPLLPRAR